MVSFFVFLTVWLTRGVPFAGFGTIVSLALLGFGFLATMLGVIAEYLGLVYEEVKMTSELRRPGDRRTAGSSSSVVERSPRKPFGGRAPT